MSRKQMIVVAVLLVLGGAWYFFFASSDQQEEVLSKARSVGYDAKHLAGKAVGEVGHKTVGSPEQARQCRDNLRRIESAKRAIGSRRQMQTGFIAIDDICREMGVKELPRCPAGGEYDVGPLLQTPRCTIGSNYNQDASDDHVLRNY